MARNGTDFGIRVAEKWRVGDKRLDNGVILFVFPAARVARLERLERGFAREVELQRDDELLRFGELVPSMAFGRWRDIGRRSRGHAARSHDLNSGCSRSRCRTTLLP